MIGLASSLFKFLFVILFLVVFNSEASEQEKIVELRVGLVRTPALNFSDKDFSGILAPAFNCAVKDFEFTATHFPSPLRLVQALNNNSIDVGLLLERNEERDDVAFYLGDFISTQVFMVHRTDTKPNRNKVIGHRAGSKALEEIALPDGFEKVKVARPEQLFEMFRLKRLDGFIELNGLIQNSMLTSETNIVTQIDVAYIGSYASTSMLKNNPDRISRLQDKFKVCQSYLPPVAQIAKEEEGIMSKAEHQ